MPSGLASLLMAWPLMMGAHEGSHQAEADRLGIPMRWDKQGHWLIPEQNMKAREAIIAGAGLRGQQELVGRLPEGDLKRAVLLMSALNKIQYGLSPSGFNLAGGDITGDTQMINNVIPGNIMQPGLVLSGLADLYRAKNPDTKWSLDFAQTSHGTPGLMFRRPW